MGKKFAFTFILVFLTASCVIVDKPVSGASTTANMWVEKAPMHVARGDLGVAAVNGEIFAIGGKSETGKTPDTMGVDYKAKGWIMDTNEKYDPATDTWNFKASMPTPRYDFAIGVYQNKIYCIGGASNFQPPNGFYGTILTGVNEVYDPATDTWKTKAPMPIPRAGLQANVINGKIYLIGGFPNGVINEVYDPVNDSWTTKAALPTQTDDGYTSVVFNNQIYEMGPNIEIYNPQTDNWSSAKQQPPTILGGIAAIATTDVMAPKRIYIFSESVNQIFDPINDTWTVGAGIPTVRGEFGAVILNDKLYLIGGIVKIYDYPFSDVLYTDTPIAVNEEYTPVGYGTISPVVSFVSPVENENYSYSCNVTLNFTIDKPFSWAGYSLDGKENITIAENTTLTGLHSGQHNVTIFVNDTYGNIGASQTINFEVAKPQPFPIQAIAAISVVIAVVIASAGLLVYFKKRKNSI